MKKEQPLLSICIPTYNRCQYLKKSIDSIVAQNEFIDGIVEVIISDNASNDDTKKIGKKYAQKYKNIHYFCNEKNIRDENFPLALSRGNGILRRLSNDTIIYKPNALSEMCHIIEKNKENKTYLCWTNGAIKNSAKMQEVDFHDFIYNVSYYITSIACFSIWEKDCIKIENDTLGCELSLWQVRKCLELASKSNCVLICNKNYTDIQKVENKNISYGLYHVFYENYFNLIDPYIKRGILTIEDKEYLEKDLLYHFFTGWCIKWEIQEKGLNYSKTENLKNLVWNQYKGKPYWKKYLGYYNIKKCKMQIAKWIRRT